MAIDPRKDAVVKPYRMGAKPGNIDTAALYREIDRLRQTVDQLTELSPQVADNPPDNPRRFTIRRAIAPWDPLGTGDAWVWYNGTAWVAL